MPIGFHARPCAIRIAAAACGAWASLLLTGAAQADRIRNPVAVFAGLDKITARIISFEVNIDETVQFGSLQITPKVCWSRPASEQPQTTSFVEVDEVTLDNKFRRIFTGWMYAASPGLHGVEHAIYDVWLTDCKGGTEVIPEPKEPEAPVAQPNERRERTRPASVDQLPDQRLDVRPPQGVPTQPRQAPTQRYFPTNRGSPATTGAPFDAYRGN
jgi:hypothetical protein